MPSQARAPKTQPFGAEAFEAGDGTVLRWLGMAGFLINSRGTTLMVDPLLGGFDMPVMIEFPIASADVPRLDAVLVTHSDNDHYSVPTCRELAGVTGEYHSTQYVASLMEQEGLPAYGHDIGEQFAIGPVRVEVTPADHSWQNDVSGRQRPHLPAGGLLRFLDRDPGRHHLGARRLPAHPRPSSADADRRCHVVRLLRQRVALRPRRCDRDGERLPETLRCCCTTGAAWTLPTSRRSTPTPTPYRAGS